ncbi:copper resistance CopC family protein [Peribacillus asahii]|uniref:copper resistance CopC family protein n=1 Tax=Peribacillus asahii TaxID=228899 RepID=UPI002079C345|nr:copper resistance protein CopC [Peribacillus asahii]USK62446.1 copper resistance protein CopC [Peribacillus asahii]
MIKKVSLLFLLFVFALCSNQAFAHTSLEESTPKDGEVITEPIQELTLIFGTKVEQTSKINVSNSNGQSIALGNFVIEEDEMWATFLQPLDNGNYKVDWSIIGADGHPIEGSFSFTVDVPMKEDSNEDSAENEEKKLKQVEDNQENSTEQSKQDVKQSNVPSYVIPSIIGILFVIVVGSVFWLMRRKK